MGIPPPPPHNGTAYFTRQATVNERWDPRRRVLYRGGHFVIMHDHL